MKSLIFLITALIFSSAQAAIFDIVKNEESIFQISVPKAWENIQKEKLKAPIVLSSIEKKKQASLIVMATTENKMSCKEFLASMDSSRGTKNSLAADKQNAGDAVLKQSGATEAVLGNYEIDGKGPGFPVIQKSICFKQKDQIRVVNVAYQKKKGAQYEPLFKEVFDSFKFLEPKKK
jgi:hypothetical protein